MRPYGNSPFAYPAGYERQDFVPFASPVVETPPPQPQMIINPYVAQYAPASATSAATPRVRANDSVEQKLVFNPHIAR
jgi:hypothetical protein